MDHGACRASSSLHSAKIIPDLVDSVGPAGGAQLLVRYGSQEVGEGNLLTPQETIDAPDVQIKASNASQLHTLVGGGLGG